MADGTKLEVTLLNDEFVELDAFTVDFVSLIAPSTYGPPPLIAPARNQHDPRAAVGDEVLYISTSGVVPAWKIKRVYDNQP